MHYSPNIRPAVVTGPLGEALTLLDLPPRQTTRWTARRKAQIVAAVEGKLLTCDEACEWYGLTAEELEEWQRASGCGGLPGLRITRSQHYRRKPQHVAVASIH